MATAATSSAVVHCTSRCLYFCQSNRPRDFTSRLGPVAHKHTAAADAAAADTAAADTAEADTAEADTAEADA